MTKTYSIAQAKDQLPRVVHEAEEGTVVELTRRGRTVAVLLSADEFERLSQPPPAPRFWDAVQRFRQEFDLAELDIRPEEVFARGREASPDRSFEW